jgi:putative transcription factor
VEECEICGSKTKDVYIVNVEDVELRVCTKCAKGKKIVSKVVERTNKPKMAGIESKKEEAQLIDDYGVAIHNAREAMKLPLKVLAEMLNEKETLLLRIEQQKTLPSVELTKKIEKALSIKLADTGEPQEKSYGGNRGDKITMADYIKRKEK